LAVVPAGHEQNVKAFLQIVPLKFFAASNRVLSLVISCRKLGRIYVTFSGCATSGSGNPSRPLTYRNCD
jgi:hypothetical protein